MDRADLDKLLSKYIVVWLWSILFGASTGLTYSLIEYRPEKWGQLALFLLVLSVLGTASALCSLIVLIKYLLRYLIPVLLNGQADGGEYTSTTLISLRRACSFLIFAAIARALMALSEIVFSYLLRF